jgi:anti-sigma B factor antagonist
MDQGTDGLTPSLRVTEGRQGRWLIVRVQGELTLETCGELTEVLSSAAEGAGRPCIAVDTSGLEFFDSSGIRCLVTACRRVQSRGGEFVVLDTGRVRRRFELLGVLPMLPVMAALPA